MHKVFNVNLTFERPVCILVVAEQTDQKLYNIPETSNSGTIMPVTESGRLKRTKRRVAYITPEEIADELRVHVKTIYAWLRKGNIRGIKIGKVWRVQREDFQIFLDENTNVPASQHKKSSSQSLKGTTETKGKVGESKGGNGRASTQRQGSTARKGSVRSTKKGSTTGKKTRATGKGKPSSSTTKAKGRDSKKRPGKQ